MSPLAGLSLPDIHECPSHLNPGRPQGVKFKITLHSAEQEACGFDLAPVSTLQMWIELLLMERAKPLSRAARVTGQH